MISERFDPFNPNSISRLNAAIEESISGLSRYRKNYNHLRNALSDPCHENKPRVEDRQVVSKLDELFTILTRACVSRNPSQRIGRTRYPRIAGMLKSQVEDWGIRHDMASKLRDALHEGLLRWCIGYMSAKVDADGVEPILKILDFEDYFIDLRQADENEIDFEGHEYEVFREELDDPNYYEQEAVQALGDGSRAREQFGQRPLYDRVRLRCCWLPRHGLILTLAADGGPKALRVQEYTGAPPGPYIRMALTKRRGTIVPTSRASSMMDLHDLCTVTLRQVFLQADQTVEFDLCDSQFEQVGEIWRTAEQGQMYTVDNVNAVRNVRKGGVNQGTLLASMQASDMFNERAGNLRLLAGQSTGEPTARQADQLGVGVDLMVRDFRLALNRFASQVYGQAAWYFLNVNAGPVKEVEWTDEAGITAPSPWTPGVGSQLPRGDPELEIIPGSMIDRSAEEQAAALLDSIRTVSGLLAVPGNKPVFLDHMELVNVLRELRNQPELGKLYGQAPDVASLVPGSETAGAAMQGGGGPAVGPRPAPGPSDRLKEKLMFQAVQPAAAPA